MNQIVKNLENLHDDVYGISFALYNNKEMEEFIRPFEIRFKKNNLDADSLFSNKKCLDAGCGNGRGGLFMAMHGASQVIALDVSSMNIESTKRNAEIFGFSEKINTQQSTLEKIPFPDEG